MTSATERMFRFREDTPPTADEFVEIATVLIESFQHLNLGPCETLTVNVEPKSWVHVQLFVGDRKEFRGDSFFVILTYTFQNSVPVASAVVSKFHNGRRVMNGNESIMTLTFSESGWSPFAWELDGFGEWECDHAAELIALKE